MEKEKTYVDQISYSFDATGVFTEDAMYYGSPNIWTEERARGERVTYHMQDELSKWRK